MIPIRELLSRIRWDPAFGHGQFEIAYQDRLSPDLQRVPLHSISFPDDRPDMFETTRPDSPTVRIPLHRIREVRRDGQLLWQRRTTPHD
jgi:uncharacterized protein (UPF0248 family)